MQNRFAGVALHTWTVDTTPLKDALAAAKQGGADGVELRQLDFKRCYEQGMNDAQVVEMVRASGNKICAVGVEYGWMFAIGEESRRLFGVFRQQCENAVALGCDHLMSATGQNDGRIADAIPNVRIAGDLAAEYGLKLSLEFNSQHPTVNCLEVAREIVNGAGKKNVGLLLDAYHLHRSGRVGRAFEDVPAEEIIYFQFSDVPAETSVGIARPTDRLPPGKGVIPWTEVFQLLAEKNYSGYLSYEAPNPAQWERPAQAVVKEGMDATRDLIAQAFRRSVA
ncbi:MAG TPA: sugar phosphate isomerase/epimerase family protein [Xanthobacteraceae bacterium]|nr:sugar phosphate isomerase/epimerase family protein [Xanthobacteraceae bacterium]